VVDVQPRFPMSTRVFVRSPEYDDEAELSALHAYSGTLLTERPLSLKSPLCLDSLTLLVSHKGKDITCSLITIICYLYFSPHKTGSSTLDATCSWNQLLLSAFHFVYLIHPLFYYHPHRDLGWHCPQSSDLVFSERFFVF
jgi:hypothetical protein